MKEVEEARKLFKANIQRSSTDTQRLGGQQVSICNSDVTLYSPDTGIKITIDYYRSQIRNYELAKQLIELAIDEIVK